MSKYTWKDAQDAQYTAQFYDSLRKRITELETENKHLRDALASRTINDINENDIERLKFVQQHLIVDTFEPHIERDRSNNWMFTWRRPHSPSEQLNNRPPPPQRRTAMINKELQDLLKQYPDDIEVNILDDIMGFLTINDIYCLTNYDGIKVLSLAN